MAIEAIKKFLLDRYAPEEYPALNYQFELWSAEKPLKDIKVLDATPVFANTMLKYINLLAAGADLTVGYSDNIPFDPAIIEFLTQIGIKTAYNSRQMDFYDVILDCNAVYRELAPEYGFAELTRSGAYHFAGTTFPVINVDDSRIKAIETCLGTGESFLRAMQYLGYNVAGKKIVVMGCGKVGRGVVFYAGRAGAEVIAVDDPQLVKKCVNGTLINRFEHDKVLDALRSAWCVVSCTGQADALNDAEYIAAVRNSSQLLVNMGVEDEWGSQIPAERVFNHKQPLNFILEEPTLLRYIDPTMALHNHAAVELVQSSFVPGIRRISAQAHDRYWQAVKNCGLITEELCEAEL